MEQRDLLALRERIGDEHLGQRLRAQTDLMVQLMGHGRGGFHFENLPLFVQVLRLMLRLTRLCQRGQRNALNVTVRENRLAIRDLPESLEGLGVLHLSDLHIDGFPGLGQHLAERISGLDFDLCVLTGDFRFYDTGRYEQITSELNDLLPALQCALGIYGILGNHDFIEMVPILEELGIRMLLNESVALAVDGTPVWLAGLDDVHLYGLHDLKKTTQGMPVGPGAMRILLVHSPELIPEAADCGFDLYLAGHTHAGQICLPNGWAPLINARCPRQFTQGTWQFNGNASASSSSMVGYTSAGTGSSGVFVRFFCSPEIVVHRLQRAA